MIHVSRARLSRKHVLIVGAGRAGVALAKDLMATRGEDVEVVGFVDDDPGKQGATLLGRPILGTTMDLPELRHTRPIDQVIAAIPSAPPRALRRIAELARGVRDFRVIPPLDALLRGKASIVQAVPVPEEALLSRRAVDLAAAELVRFFDGKTVLVTGAGGSIGGELARQLAGRRDHRLRKLLLLDAAETPLYDVHRQAKASLGSRAVGILASVRDRRRMAELIRIERPDVILHAAALKHVPLCEEHPMEALATNCVATARLADVAGELGVPHFTLVSTDKAVAPACVMGASKRAAEVYLKALAQDSKTCFAAVRFGNVLGSNGSVLPLFHEQIARGGPVTVTDATATRFFMTIPEACGLILQATRLARTGETYVLEMGEPVRILDVAHNLIRLYGYEPGRDIEVRIIGLRPGEKLHERLVDEAEEAEPLQQAKLLRIHGRSPSPERCRQLMARLDGGLRRRRPEEAMRALRDPRPDVWRIRDPCATHGADEPGRSGSYRMSVLALVPARSGSKGVPDKNVMSFRGKPLLVHSIEHGLAARNVDRVMVSTDSPSYREIALEAGAEAPFLRPPSIAQDRSTDLEVFTHALDWLERHEGYRPDILAHLRPTYPTRRSEDVEGAVDMLLADPSADSVRSVTQAPHTPYKMWRIESGRLSPLLESSLPEAYNRPRQDLPVVYMQNAAVDAVRSRVILEDRSMTGSRILPYVMDRFEDVDDWRELAAVERAAPVGGPPEGLTFVFDVDGVIASIAPENDYRRARPFAPGIAALNRLHAAGNRVVICTARGDRTGQDWAEMTHDQLRRWGVQYDELRFGKPAADYYVDDRAMSLATLEAWLAAGGATWRNKTA